MRQHRLGTLSFLSQKKSYLDNLIISHIYFFSTIGINPFKYFVINSESVPFAKTITFWGRVFL